MAAASDDDDDDDEGAQRRLIVTAADLDARCIGLAKSSAALSGVCTGEVVRASLINDEPAAVANGVTPPPSQPLHTTDERLSEDEAFGGQEPPSPSEPPPSEPPHIVPPPNAGSLRLAHADARALLFLEANAYDYLHLDPFGSCAPFLDAFLARSPHGGLLSLTATDTSALYAHYPAVALRTYGAELQRADPNFRESAVRVLCAAVATAAARQLRGVQILHATSAAHFVHVLLRVRRGAAAADSSVNLVRMLTTPDGASLGPMWAGPLNSPAFLRRCVTAAEAAAARSDASPSDQSAAAKARSIFERSLNDPGSPPFSRPTGHVSAAKLVAALREAGYFACCSAFDGDATKKECGTKRVRTDAPEEVVRQLMEAK